MCVLFVLYQNAHSVGITEQSEMSNGLVTSALMGSFLKVHMFFADLSVWHWFFVSLCMYEGTGVYVAIF